MFYALALLSCAAFVVGGESPQANYVRSLYKESDITGFTSDNIIQDALLDVPRLVRRYNYPLEVHNVRTQDGYVLGVHRIPFGRDANNKPGRRPAVLLMHGLTASSADYVLMGPGSALGYMLAEAGYDVWMGNARGNFYSRRHIRFNPDRNNNDFWKFSWDDIGEKDLPAMIDYILRQTRNSALHYVGQSQGTTAFFVMCALQPAYNRKIISMHALAPVAYLAHNQNDILNTVASFGNSLETIASTFGIQEVFASDWQSSSTGAIMCRDGASTQKLCTGIFFLIGGESVDQHNTTMLPVKLGHAPAGSSVRQFVHFGQSITEKGFRRFDHGTVGNLVAYGRRTPPNYDLSRVTAPVYLHYAERDPLAEVKDVERLYNELGGPKQKFKVPHETFGHLDFVWGIDANRLVYDLVISLMKSSD